MTQQQEVGSSTRTNHSDGQFVISNCRRNPDAAEAEEKNDSSEDTDSEDRVLSTYYRGGKLGAAYYSLRSGELFVLEELVDRAPEFQMFSNLYRQVEPARLVLEGCGTGAFVHAVKQTVFRSGSSDADDETRCQLVFLSPREYSFEACKRRIFSLSLPNEPKGCSEEERSVFLRTALDFGQTQSVHALGALLRYLDLNWSSLNLDLHAKPQFLSLRKISLSDIVTIDEDTYRGLQIFNSVAHPSNYKKGVQGSSKEGVSLFQLFSKCSSKVGHSRMRVFLRHPSTDLALLLRRQDAVEFFVRPQNEPLTRNICASLRYIKNVNGILAKIKALTAKPFQWRSLYNTIYNSVLICELCENAGNSSELLQELALYNNSKLYEMALYMNKIIDFDLSKTERKFTVKAGVDPELDIKKQTMASLHGLMSETAKVELDRLPTFIEECTMLYMPHLGYLLGVKAWADYLTMEQKELPNMKFMFQNNDYIHYKSKGCEELDLMIGDTYPEIMAHETRIMMRLAAVVLENLHTLSALVDKCADLDCLIAISKVCREYNYVRPSLTQQRLLRVRAGRHPLLLAACDTCVPNDATWGGGDAHVHVLTGPNASGKSVYMKQIGLIVYLAQIGSFVPAEQATVGLVSHIHSRIQSTECVAAHMSAFLIDLRQMALALQESPSNSLIIIDEFGKGTSEVDGLSLLAASLNTLLFRGDACPHVLLATHLLSLKQFIIDTPLLNFLSFEHVMQDGAPVFLFRVTQGCAETSFAHQVAATSGLDAHVLQRAAHVMDALTNNTLPAENKKIVAKLDSYIEIMKSELLCEDI